MTDSKETLMQKWAVKTVQDPTVGNLQTPVNSGWFTRMVINNLPVYREGLSPNFRGLETGAIFGYLLFGPFSMTGPLRNTDFALTAGLLGGVGAIQILTALFILYNAPGKAPNIQPPDATVINPPADLFTRSGWSEFTNGFWLGGTGGVVFAWLLIGTLHLDTVLPLIKEYHLLGA